MDALGFRAVLGVILSDARVAVFLLLILCSSISMSSSKLNLLFSLSIVVTSSSELSRVITSVIFIFFEESEGLILVEWLFDRLDPDLWVFWTLAIFSETILSMTLVCSQEHEQLFPILYLMCLIPEETEEALATDKETEEALVFCWLAGPMLNC